MAGEICINLRVYERGDKEVILLKDLRMAEFLRRQIMIPDRVYNTLRRYDPAAAWEVFEAIRDYAHYWDVHRSDAGFDLSCLSPDAKAVFLSVYDELFDCNSAYFERCALARQATVEKNKQDKQRKQTRERVNKYRQKNKKCNAKSADYGQKSVTVTQCNAKNRPAHNSAQSKSGSAIESKSVTLDKNGKYTKKALQNCPQSQSQQGIAESCAGYKDYCNSSLHSELQGYWKGGMGENRVMHNAAMDNFAAIDGSKPLLTSPCHQGEEISCLGVSARMTRREDAAVWQGDDCVRTCRANSNQTSGLSCSKAVPDIRDPEPVMSGSRGAAGSEGSKTAVNGSEAIGRCLIPELSGNSGRHDGDRGGSEVVSSKRPTAGISKDVVPPEEEVPKTKSLPSAPHAPEAHEVLITKGFKIDLADDFFYPYRRADKFLLRGVENWLAANKRGCSVEKRWICKQIYKFAERQGKVNILLGADLPD